MIARAFWLGFTVGFFNGVLLWIRERAIILQYQYQ